MDAFFSSFGLATLLGGLFIAVIVTLADYAATPNAKRALFFSVGGATLPSVFLLTRLFGWPDEMLLWSLLAVLFPFPFIGLGIAGAASGLRATRDKFASAAHKGLAGLAIAIGIAAVVVTPVAAHSFWEGLRGLRW